MKVGVTTSAIAHAAIIGFGLLTLSAPAALEVADVESLPVDIVPIEALTQIQQGEKTAPLKEKSAPKPTEKPALPVDNAQKVGEAEVETDTPPTPEPAKRPVQTAAAPPPEPTPAPVAKPEPKAVPEPKPAEPTPPPATEKTAKAEPPQKVEPEPVEKPAVVEKPEAEAMPLPTQAPSPQSRPQPRQAQTAKAPERKEAEKPAEKQQQRPKSEESKFNADDIAALLDKQKPSGGGAKRSQQEAALGGQRNDPGMKLSQSEMDALRGQIQRCWNVPAGALEAENLKVSIKFSLDRSGAISVQPQIVSGGGSAGVERAAAESARRAVLQCAPYNLPAEKYEAWADVIVNFDPSDMF